MLKRAWWALGSALGGDREPKQGWVRAVRHPLRFAAGGAVFFGGIAALAIGRVDLQIVLYSLVMGTLSGLAAVAERKRIERRGFRLDAPRPDADGERDNR